MDALALTIIGCITHVAQRDILAPHPPPRNAGEGEKAVRL